MRLSTQVHASSALSYSHDPLNMFIALTSVLLRMIQPPSPFSPAQHTDELFLHKVPITVNVCNTHNLLLLKLMNLFEEVSFTSSKLTDSMIHIIETPHCNAAIQISYIHLVGTFERPKHVYIHACLPSRASFAMFAYVVSSIVVYAFFACCSGSVDSLLDRLTDLT